jgi:chromosome segregation ATPase
VAIKKSNYLDFATQSPQTTLAAVLAKLADLESELATKSKPRTLLEAISTRKPHWQVLAKLADLESELTTIKANQLSGDQKVTLKDASGAVVSPATEATLEQVRALLSGVATENKLEQARTLLEAISTKDFATQTTLAAVLAKLADLESELATIKANQLSGDQKVFDVCGRRSVGFYW